MKPEELKEEKTELEKWFDQVTHYISMRHPLAFKDVDLNDVKSRVGILGRVAVDRGWFLGKATSE